MSASTRRRHRQRHRQPHRRQHRPTAAFAVAAVLTALHAGTAAPAAAVPATTTTPAAAAPAVAASAAAAGGEGANPFSPRAGHGYRHGAVPTREAHRELRAWRAAHTPQAVVSPANLRYGGGVHGIGVTTGRPRVYLVFHGSQWGSTGTDPAGYTTFSGDRSGVAVRLQQLFSGIGTGGELWSGVLTQYCEGVAPLAQGCPADVPHVGYPTGGALAGVFADTALPAPDRETGRQLAQAAVAAAVHFGNTAPEQNRSAQYVVVSPTGTHPDGFGTASGNFCAWHDWNGDPGLPGGPVDSGGIGDIAFTNLPYVPDAGASCGAGFVNPGSAGALDGLTIVAGHEYAETVTDQNPAGGWTDSSGEENADKCAWLRTGPGPNANVTFSTGTFAMSGTWSNDTAACALSHPVVTPGAGAVTVTDPGPRTAVAGVPTTLQLRGTDTAGLALTWSATGLPPGLSLEPATGLVSGTPTLAGSYATTVTATDPAGGAGSTGFVWTVAPAGSCAGTGQKLRNPGFETGTAAPWTASAAVVDGSATQPARTGQWKAWLDGYGTTHTDSLNQTVTLPAGCRSYLLSFWVHISTAETSTTAAYDRLIVKAGTSTLLTLSNLNRNTGWTRRTVDLKAFAGRTFSLRFIGIEDGSLQTSFVIDDTAVTVT